MAWLKSRVKTLFSNKKKQPTKLDKGKGRAVEPEPSRQGRPSSANSSSSNVSDSDLLPLLHYSEIYLAPQVLREYPAFYLIGHPLPPPPLPQAKKLLTASEEVKKTLIHPRKSTVRGYNSAKGSGREWWDYTPEEGGTKLTLDDEHFRKTTTEYFNKSISLLQEICKHFNISENSEVVPQDIIDDQGFSTMRYLRYSPRVFVDSAGTSNGAPKTNDTKAESKDKPSSMPRMEAHTDHGVLTLMTATEPSGLYVWDRDGTIYSAPPIENTVLVIAGDLMTHFTTANKQSPLEGTHTLSEKTVLPTIHAVLIPKDAGERYSVAVFLRPKRDQVVSKRNVKKLVDGKEVEEIEEMTFSNWAEEKGKVKGRRCWMIGQEGIGLDE